MRMRGKFLMVVVEGKVHVMKPFGLGWAAHQGFLPTHALCAESRHNDKAVPCRSSRWHASSRRSK
jgi:hypothetical protein